MKSSTNDLFGWKTKKPRWPLDEFVEIANRYLPQYLPTVTSDARITDKINSRLVRYYTTQGMLDEPEKTGRTARYTYRHLLQIVVVRRLLAEGYAGGVIGQLATSKDDDELEALLQGGVQLTVSVANPALAYLYEILGTSPAAATTGSRGARPKHKAPNRPLQESSWKRTEIVPGCELHISNTFKAPKSSAEQDYIVQTIVSILKKLEY